MGAYYLWPRHQSESSDASSSTFWPSSLTPTPLVVVAWAQGRRHGLTDAADTSAARTPQAGTSGLPSIIEDHPASGAAGGASPAETEVADGASPVETEVAGGASPVEIEVADSALK